MKTPTIHLNGTSRAALAEGYREAAEAVCAARAKLEAAAPNARDYYPQGPGAFALAAEEHAARLRQLSAVQTELYALLVAVEDAP